MTAAERMQLKANLHHRHLHSLISARRETQLPAPPPTQAPALASAIPTAAINAIADAVANYGEALVSIAAQHGGGVTLDQLREGLPLRTQRELIQAIQPPLSTGDGLPPP